MANPIPKTSELTVIIPWVHFRTDAGYIKEEFNDLDWGEVQKIDFIFRDHVTLPNGKPNPKHYKVYIHFNNLTDEGKRIKEYLTCSNEIKVNHYHGHWLVRISTWKYNAINRDKSKGKPKVEFI